MAMTPRRLCARLIVGLGIIAGGCGGGGPGAGPGTEGDVSGTVTLKGKPVPSGEVLFEPTGGPAADTAPRTASLAGGSYSVILIPGQYRVTVQQPQAGKPSQPLGGSKQLDVESGPKKFDIAL